MKKRIYLFCNYKYGNAYLKVFRDVAHKLPNFECYAVFSTKGMKTRSYQKFAKIIRHPFKYRYKQSWWVDVSEKGLKILEVENVNCLDFVEAVPIGSIGFVAGFNQIFKKPVIDRFSSFINFHPSLLPYYRGSIPSYWTIKNNERISGFTAHVVTEKVDAGEIIYQELVELNQDVTEEELDCKIAAVGSFYFIECLKAIELGKPFRRNRVTAQYFHKVDYVPAVRE